jgi:hypothetical protein
MLFLIHKTIFLWGFFDNPFFPQFVLHSRYFLFLFRSLTDHFVVVVVAHIHTEYWYDPGQFIKNGGFYASALTSTEYYFAYYFSLCSKHPNSKAVANCKSNDAAVCMVKNGVGSTLGQFSNVRFIAHNDYKKGFQVLYSNPSAQSASCPSGTAGNFKEVDTHFWYLVC